MIRQLMPWQATGPGDVTILRARGKRLTKLVTPTGIVEYDNPALFSVEAVRVDRVEDFADLIGAATSDSCVIRAVLKDVLGPHHEIRRRLHDDGAIAARFIEVRRDWAMVDLEPSTAPAGINPTDPVLVGGWLRQRLPLPFQLARCVVQLSSGAGIKSGLRAHLWFKLDRALTGAELDRLLGDVDGIDPSTFRPVQIHYCADPIFDGVDDPCIDGRIAILPGHAEVAVPALAPAKPRQAFIAFIAAGHGHGRAGAGGAERYAAACLRRLALAPEGRRHPTCIAVACRLLAIAKAGQLDPIRIASRIKAVMQGKGFDGRNGRDLGEIDKILEWAWATVKPEELPR